MQHDKSRQGSKTKAQKRRRIKGRKKQKNVYRRSSERFEKSLDP